MAKNRTKRIFASQNVAGTCTATFDISDMNHVSLQVVITEDCLSAASFVCECISLSANSYTEPNHGFETGLKGTLAATIGCAVALPVVCCTVCACCNLFTLACHGLTEGERGQFTTTCADLPCGLCVSTNYFVIVVDACNFKVAATRANAIAACPTSVTFSDAGTGTHTFTPNGAIPTGSTACSFIIKVDCCTFKLATSKANALAGTVDTISALNSPASMSFTPACADCTSGTVTVRYSNCSGPCATYLVDAGIGLLATPGTITACGLSVNDAETGAVPYQSMQVEVCVTDSQWTVTVDAHAKE